MDKLTRHAALDLLQAVPLFSIVERTDLDALLDGCRLLRVPAGGEILSPAGRADRFFVILAGRVKLFQLSPRGDEQILHLYGPGATFGEAAMWAGGYYPAYAEAVAMTRLLVVERAVLLEMIGRRPELAVAMMAGLSRKLQEFNRLIERLSLKEVPARLAAVLLQIAEESGAAEFELARTKRELASQIGTVAETLSRALAKLRGEGLIEVDGQRIRILDASKLRELAES